MDYKYGCIVCGSELIYSNEDKEFLCYSCRESFISNVSCSNEHFICDSCHALSANEYIEQVCSKTQTTDPLRLADEIMKHPSVKMHGPEHHFLVPAVLIVCYYNKIKEPEKIQPALKKARKRADLVLGGFCGSHGTCGAGTGAGIFLSIISNSTPLKREEWKHSNMLTGICLQKIAEKGGPRCCKRDSYTAIEEAVKYCNENYSAGIELVENQKCSFFDFNNECLKEECEYYTHGT